MDYKVCRASMNPEGAGFRTDLSLRTWDLRLRDVVGEDVKG